MTDIDDRLHKYRPSDPPPELRDRVLQAAERVVARPIVSGVARPFQGRDSLALVAWPFKGRDLVREWLPVTLAASIAIIFHLFALSARANVPTNFVSTDGAREAMVADLTSQLGGDEAAKEEAEQLMQLGEDASRADAEHATLSGAEVPGHRRKHLKNAGWFDLRS